MINLLQEVLCYIEEQHRILEALDEVTIVSRAKYDKIYGKIVMELITMLNKSYTDDKLLKDFPKTRNIEPEEVECCEERIEDNDLLRIDDHDKNESVIIEQKTENSTKIPVQNYDENQSISKSFICVDCKKVFVSEKTLRGHRSTVHNAYRPFVCHTCGMAFKRKDIYTKHCQLHTGEKPYKCNLCDKSFPLKDYLTRHIAAHHNPSKHIKSLFICDVCGKNCQSRKTLTQHYRIHTGEPGFKCQHCDKEYSFSGSLRLHVATHHNPDGLMKKAEKKFECKICNKRFTTKAALVKHKVLHTGERPFRCDICGKHYAFQNVLFDHKRFVHSTDKKFKCDQCNMEFKRKTNFQRHMFLHTGKKPFHCEICTRKFAQKGDLKKHLQIHSRPSQQNQLIQMNPVEPISIVTSYMKTQTQ